MDNFLNYKALCFVEQNFAKKHNAFFSHAAKGEAGTVIKDSFWVLPLDLTEETSAKNFAGNVSCMRCGSEAEESFPPLDFYVFDSISSTLDICHELSAQGKVRPFSSIVCREQTKGRGQLRREWKSLADNLYTALVLPDAYPFNTEAAAPAVGALFAQALYNLGFSVELKWPNDLVQKGQTGYEKVGGILLEERNGFLVAGTGINLFSCPGDSDLRENFFISAGRLSGFGRRENIGKFLNKFYNYLAQGDGICLPSTVQYLEKTDETDIFSAILGFWFALVKEIKLCYEKKILSCNTHTWNALCKKYLAFLGDTVLIKDALIKEDSCANELFAGDLAGQIIGLGQEGELLLSSQSGLMCIVGGSITKFKG